MCEIISCRMSDRVLLCIGRLSIMLRSKKMLLAGGRGDEMSRSYYQEVNESRLTDHLIKYREREKERAYTIDFKAFVYDFF